MRFLINSAEVADDDATYDQLDIIVQRSALDIHEFLVLDADLLQTTRWYQSSRENRKAFLKKAAQSGAYKNKSGISTAGLHSKLFHISTPSDLLKASRLAMASLIIITENRETDGTLIECAINTLGTPEMIDLCLGSGSKADPPACYVDSGGGFGEVEKLIDQHTKAAQERGRPTRIIVIIDSDGEFVGDVKTHALKIRQRCAEDQLPCPPLNKRTVENYIPDSVWRHFASKRENTAARPAIEALLRLTPEQRDHMNMGARNERAWRAESSDAAALFSSVSDDDAESLAGFPMKKSGDIYRIKLLDIYSDVVTPAAIKSRDHQGDLEMVVRTIREEL